jgi:hypothetical protein
LPYRKSIALAILVVIGFGSYYKLSNDGSPSGKVSASAIAAAAQRATPSAPASASPSPSPSPAKKKKEEKPAAKKQTGGLSDATSALHWLSGVSYPDYNAYSSQDADASAAFGSWRGRPTTVVVTWPNRNVWTDFTEPNAMYSEWAAQPYKKVFGLPMFPEGVGADIQSCDNGDYNSEWQQFAQTMNSTGLAAQGTIIRLGWEMNDTSGWGTPEQFAECWRQIVSTVSAIAPGLLWDWNPNRGSGTAMPGSSILQAYPGNAYVNIIGVDSYDDWPDALTSAGWQQQLNGPYGLNYWLNFAEQNGKQFSVPEWADVPSDEWPGESGGDDPAYIKDMYDFFAANAGGIAFESYYCDVGYCIDNPNQYPQSAAKYQSLWGS